MPSFGFDTTRFSLWEWCRLRGAGQRGVGQKILARALQWILAEKSTFEKRTETPAPEQAAHASVSHVERADGAAVPVAALGPIGLTVRGKSPPRPFSPRSTGGKAKVFHGRRASRPAIRHFSHSRLTLDEFPGTPRNALKRVRSIRCDGAVECYEGYLLAAVLFLA